MRACRHPHSTTPRRRKAPRKARRRALQPGLRSVLSGLGVAVLAGTLLAGHGAFAQDAAGPLSRLEPTAPAALRPTLGFNGMPGLMDMPTAGAMPDGEMALTLSSFAGFSRANLAWQLTPRLSAAFRYSLFENVNRGNFRDYYDRSFDLRYQLAFEGRYRPALVVGLQDFAGTGFYSGEYLVASKTLAPNLSVSGGLGWGRYGSYNDLGTPFGDNRPRGGGGDTGGQLAYDSWFRGPVAAFGGVEWRPTERLGLKLEYASDAYDFEAGQQKTFERRMPFNFGVEYQVNDRLRVGAYSLYGDRLGLQASIAINPRRPASPRADGAPTPVLQRPDRLRFPAAWRTDWDSAPLRPALAAALKAQGQTLLGARLEARRATLWVENRRYLEPAAAAGRIARAMARHLPASVETFDIVMVRDGVPASTLRLSRRDLEVLETAPERAEALLARAVFAPGQPLTRQARLPELYPRFQWRLSPYTRTSYFDPRNPVLIQLGLRLQGSYELSPGLALDGAVTQRLGGNLDRARISSNDKVAVVRTDWPDYYTSDTPQLERLTLNYATGLGGDVYGLLSAGYLERMYAGVSGELLWKPVDSRLALGARLSHVRKRAPDEILGLEDYDVTTGHVSAYYELESGYLAQVDVGRYLAGDLGGTLRLSREFANGWRVSAFATLTDISADDFGEGSFDKGISFAIPLSWASGKGARSKVGHVIRPVQRDGGAMVNTRKLYNSLRGAHQERYEDGWPLIWR